MNNKKSLGRISVTIVLLVITAIAMHAQTFTTLVNFAGTDGINPLTSLIQGSDGNFYGTTMSGGANSFYGTIFRVTPDGALTTMYSFCPSIQLLCPDGYWPFGGIIEATDGNFYGTTAFGGAHGAGTIFKMTPDGTLTTLYSFCALENCSDGSHPYTGLIQASGGNLYGTAFSGGANTYGTIFKISPDGVFTTLHSFDGLDGEFPYTGLIQAMNGNFYGTTSGGGAAGPAAGHGTVYKMNLAGTVTRLHSFRETDGDSPYAGLVHSNGNLFGTTQLGGANNAGTIFEIARDGTLTTLHSFDSTGGEEPYGGLIQGSDGNFYGTTLKGAAGYGSVFSFNPEGTTSTLHSFAETDGSEPQGGLMQATDGTLYGTTVSGGVNGLPGGYGTVYRLSLGLRPFLKLLPTSGAAGSTVKILGTNLTSATGVAFNGVAAPFTIISPSLIVATVPAGVTTGQVRVATADGPLSSNTAFLVLP